MMSYEDMCTLFLNLIKRYLFCWIDSFIQIEWSEWDLALENVTILIFKYIVVFEDTHKSIEDYNRKIIVASKI
jgi:hypothetical protein